MDYKEYIASGILELYALGALSQEESMAVERIAAEQPEVAEELRAIQQALTTYSKVYERNPHPSLRHDVMQRIGNINNSTITSIRPIYKSHQTTYKYLLAACIASLIVSTFASIFFFKKWGEAEEQYTAMLNEKNVMAQDYNFVKYENNKMSADMLVMHNPDMDIITLNSTDSTRQYKVRVYWNKLTQQTYVDLQNLPVPDSSMQYQLWVLVEGKPVDAGVLDMNEIGMQKVKPVITADKWAMTLEPRGGSASPTLSQLILMSPS